MIKMNTLERLHAQIEKKFYAKSDIKNKWDNFTVWLMISWLIGFCGIPFFVGFMGGLFAGVITFFGMIPLALLTGGAVEEVARVFFYKKITKKEQRIYDAILVEIKDLVANSDNMANVIHETQALRAFLNEEQEKVLNTLIFNIKSQYVEQRYEQLSNSIGDLFRIYQNIKKQWDKDHYVENIEKAFNASVFNEQEMVVGQTNPETIKQHL